MNKIIGYSICTRKNGRKSYVVIDITGNFKLLDYLQAFERNENEIVDISPVYEGESEEENSMMAAMRLAMKLNEQAERFA